MSFGSWANIHHKQCKWNCQTQKQDWDLGQVYSVNILVLVSYVLLKFLFRQVPLSRFLIRLILLVTCLVHITTTYLFEKKKKKEKLLNYSASYLFDFDFHLFYFISNGLSYDEAILYSLIMLRTGLGIEIAVIFFFF